ncbi:hypothetical protein I862_01945 [endosymbiont of Acanthamoeba sp. UWC8]|nr:hypothetical protein I862_01945 [endosymbiont of Acanthamoeba sp. UWC8]
MSKIKKFFNINIFRKKYLILKLIIPILSVLYFILFQISFLGKEEINIFFSISNIFLIISIFIIKFPRKYKILFLPFFIMNIFVCCRGIGYLVVFQFLEYNNDFIFIILILLVYLFINFYMLYLFLSIVKLNIKK